MTRKDAYPLPRIDVTVDALHGSQYFSTLDLVSGYWQVELEESDKEKTALRACISSESCPLGSVMPLRLFSDHGLGADGSSVVAVPRIPRRYCRTWPVIRGAYTVPGTGVLQLKHSKCSFFQQ